MIPEQGRVYLVDGYNVLYAWAEFASLIPVSLEEARDLLTQWMAEFQAFSGIRVLLVFDAHHAAGAGQKERRFGVDVYFTKENETADQFIEKSVREWEALGYEVYVVTSDYTEQRVAFAQGALRLSARDLHREWRQVKRAVEERLKKTPSQPPRVEARLPEDVRETLERWRRQSN